MKENNKNKGDVFYLGINNYDGYDILVHEIHQPQGTATLLYSIREENICDGDGIWMDYDDKSVKISHKDYHYVKSIFKSCGNEIVKLGEENGLPIEREIKENDCIYYRGSFLLIENAPSTNDKWMFKAFFYDGYELDTDQESYDWDKYFGYEALEDLRKDGLLINSGIYNLALSKANAAIAEVQYYLYNLYMSKKEKNGNA